MYTLAVENERGEFLELTHKEGYEIGEVQGLGPPPANINTTATAGGDGSSFNSASLNNRNIVIYLYITSDIENNRQRLYKYFRIKRKCRLYFKNANRNVYIDGRVETFEPAIFANVQEVQISIICEKPYFKNVNSSVYDFSWTVSGFEFPFSIEESGIEFSTSNRISSVNVLNNGENEVGLEITLTATGTVLNPHILNLSTGGTFALNAEMQEGDKIIITTHTGNKRVTLIKGGEETNIMNTVAKNPEWFALDLGDNIFSYSADIGGEFLAVSLKLTEEFAGV